MIQNRMNPEIKARWIEALRSGEYEQGHNMLCTQVDGKPVGYCCLGVLADLAIKEVPGARWEIFDRTKDVQFYDEIHDMRESSALPQCVQDWAGLDRELPRVLNTSLAELNDGIYDPPFEREEEYYRHHGDTLDRPPLTFDQIADLIEYFL